MHSVTHPFIKAIMRAYNSQENVEGRDPRTRPKGTLPLKWKKSLRVPEKSSLLSGNNFNNNNNNKNLLSKACLASLFPTNSIIVPGTKESLRGSAARSVPRDFPPFPQEARIDRARWALRWAWVCSLTSRPAPIYLTAVLVDRLVPALYAPGALPPPTVVILYLSVYFFDWWLFLPLDNKQHSLFTYSFICHAATPCQTIF